MKRIFAVFCVLIMCLFGLSGCSSSKTTYYLYDCVEKNGVYYYFDINQPEMLLSQNFNIGSIDIVQFGNDPDNYYYAYTYSTSSISASPYFGRHSGIAYIPTYNYRTVGKRAVLVSNRPYEQLSNQERALVPLYKTDYAGAISISVDRGSTKSVIKYFTVNEK